MRYGEDCIVSFQEAWRRSQFTPMISRGSRLGIIFRQDNARLSTRLGPRWEPSTMVQGISEGVKDRLRHR